MSSSMKHDGPLLETTEIETCFQNRFLSDWHLFTGGLKVSSLITSNLVSHYIPFLPLEKRHVRQCVNDELANRNVSSQKSDELREKIISQLSFTPEGVELYSISGCKRVHAKIDLVMEEEGYPWAEEERAEDKHQS